MNNFSFINYALVNTMIIIQNTSYTHLLTLVPLSVNIPHLVTDGVFLICWEEPRDLPKTKDAADGL